MAKTNLPGNDYSGQQTDQQRQQTGDFPSGRELADSEYRGEDGESIGTIIPDDHPHAETLRAMSPRDRAYFLYLEEKIGAVHKRVFGDH